MGIGGGCVVDGFFAIVAVGFCCSGNRLCLDWMVGFFDWLYEFERKREVGGGGWFFSFLMVVAGFFFFWHKCTFSPYLMHFFHFSPYILFLSLLVPKLINT